MRAAFLLFPRTINGETRWMERVEWEEEWVPSRTMPGGSGPRSHWETVRWADQPAVPVWFYPSGYLRVAMRRPSPPPPPPPKPLPPNTCEARSYIREAGSGFEPERTAPLQSADEAIAAIPGVIAKSFEPPDAPQEPGEKATTLVLPEAPRPGFGAGIVIIDDPLQAIKPAGDLGPWYTALQPQPKGGVVHVARTGPLCPSALFDQPEASTTGTPHGGATPPTGIASPVEPQDGETRGSGAARELYVEGEGWVSYPGIDGQEAPAGPTMARIDLTPQQRATYGACRTCGAQETKPCTKIMGTGMINGAHLGRIAVAPHTVLVMPQ